MKFFSTLILCFFVTTVSFSQVQKLQQLSSGELISSRIIYEENHRDVFGYFLLYKIDKTSSTFYELEYVVLDKNINKITSGVFNQGVSSLLGRSGPYVSFVKKIDEMIYFGMYDYDFIGYFSDYISQHLNPRFRTINLNDFSISPEIIIKDSKVVENENVEREDLRRRNNKDNQMLYPTKSDYFVVFGGTDRGYRHLGNARAQLERFKSSERKMMVLDKNLQEVWSVDINKDKEKFEHYYFDSDQHTLIIQKVGVGRKRSSLMEAFHYDIYDIHTGKLIGTMTNTDPNYTWAHNQIYYTDDEIVFFCFLRPKKMKKFNSEKTLGYVKVVLDKATGKETKRDYLLWENLQPHLTFSNKYGMKKRYGQLIAQEFIPLNNGNIIGVFEGYKFSKNSEILDIFIMEFDPNMKVKYFNKIEKIKTKLRNAKFSGYYLKQNGYMDYYYSQPLDDDGNHVILFSNNEREGSRHARRRKPDWSLGIVTYVDGAYNYDKLQLTKEDGMVLPFKAKNGFILLSEFSESGNNELRLERINY